MNEHTIKQTALLYVRFCYIINTKLSVTFSELSRYSRYRGRERDSMSFTRTYIEKKTHTFYTHECIDVLPLIYVHRLYVCTVVR